MPPLTPLARIAYAIAIFAFGCQHLIYGAFVTRLIPKLPAAIPHQTAWADLAGILLIAAAAALLFPKTARPAALLLGAALLLSFLFLYLPPLCVTPPLGPLWTNAGKCLAIAAGAFLLAALPFSRLFLSAFLIVAGIQHFLYVPFVATLVPRWIPAPIFWTYFAGIALIAGGLGILIPKLTRVAALLTALMIFLWIVLLHIPRALAAPHDSNETTAVFEALAVCATALLVAAIPETASPRPTPLTTKAL